MSRRRTAVGRQIAPDTKYFDRLVSKLITTLMMDGKKAVAERIVYKALDLIKLRTNKNPIRIFKIALANIKPKVEVSTRRVGGASIQAPGEVRPVRRLALSLRWLRDGARARSEKVMYECLANEILDASLGKGDSIRKCDDTYRAVEANKAFSTVGY